MILAELVLIDTQVSAVAEGPARRAIAHYTVVDSQCHRLAKVVGRTSTVASIVHLVRPRTVAVGGHL